ncbi:MAG TPA: hypothetical protein VGJ04_09860 [Pirellulales bacterium]
MRSWRTVRGWYGSSRLCVQIVELIPHSVLENKKMGLVVQQGPTH